MLAQEIQFWESMGGSNFNSARPEARLINFGLIQLSAIPEMKPLSKLLGRNSLNCNKKQNFQEKG